MAGVSAGRGEAKRQGGFSWEEKGASERRPGKGVIADVRGPWRWRGSQPDRSARIVKADLTYGVVESLVIETEIAKTFQQALGEIVETTEELSRCGGVILRQSLKQTAHLEHLQEQMGNLQEVVEGFHHVRMGAVGVLKVQAAVLLDVKALVFDVPTYPAALVSHGADGVGAETQVGDPGEGLRTILAAFLAEQGTDDVTAALVVDVFQIIDPAKDLLGLIGQRCGQSILRTEFEQVLKLLP